MTGMLWFSNDPKTDLEQKVTQAASYYEKKYGKKPNRAWVHNSALNGIRERFVGPVTLAGVIVESVQFILPNHILIGD